MPPPKELDAIFAAALEIDDPHRRQAFLVQRCPDEPSRQRVESLLRAYDDAGSFLEKPLDVLIANLNGRADAPQEGFADGGLGFLEPCDKPDRIGMLGAYEILGEVGRGGMGIVLRAFDPRLHRIMAIKVLAPEMARNPTAVQRFFREARAAAAVSHDHVVTIYAVEESKNIPFLVMEFVPGPSLQEKIDRHGAFSARETLRIGMQIAAGLSAAHRQGLIHRDIKPSNILLENGVERVKLTDFGLARAVDDIAITQTGQITGTPQYMAPEQVRGETVDHRSDLFSLGCVLYAMCTGRAAFRADSTLAVLRRVCDCQPRPIQDVNPDVPDWLVKIVGRLLAKNPEDRFQSAEEVANLLSEHLFRLQTGGREAAALPNPTSTAMRSGLRIGLAVGVAGLAVVIGAMALLNLVPTDKPAAPARGLTEVAPLEAPGQHMAFAFDDPVFTAKHWAWSDSMQMSDEGGKAPRGPQSFLRSRNAYQGRVAIELDFSLGQAHYINTGGAWITVWGRQLKVNDGARRVDAKIHIHREGDQIVYVRNGREERIPIAPDWRMRPTTIEIRWRSRVAHFRQVKIQAETITAAEGTHSQIHEARGGKTSH